MAIAATPEVPVPVENPLPQKLASIKEEVSAEFDAAGDGRLPKPVVLGMLRHILDRDYPGHEIPIERLVFVASRDKWVEPKQERTHGTVLHYNISQFLILGQGCLTYLEFKTKGNLYFNGQPGMISWGEIHKELKKSLEGTKLSCELGPKDESQEPNFQITATQPLNNFPFPSSYLMREDVKNERAGKNRGEKKDVSLEQLLNAWDKISGQIETGGISRQTKLYPGMFGEFLHLEIEADLVFLIGLASQKIPICYNDCTVSDFLKLLNWTVGELKKIAQIAKEAKRKDPVCFSEVLMKVEGIWG